MPRPNTNQKIAIAVKNLRGVDIELHVAEDVRAPTRGRDGRPFYVARSHAASRRANLGRDGVCYHVKGVGHMFDIPHDLAHLAVEEPLPATDARRHRESDPGLEAADATVRSTVENEQTRRADRSGRDCVLVDHRDGFFAGNAIGLTISRANNHVPSPCRRRMSSVRLTTTGVELPSGTIVACPTTYARFPDPRISSIWSTLVGFHEGIDAWKSRIAARPEYGVPAIQSVASEVNVAAASSHWPARTAAVQRSVAARIAERSSGDSSGGWLVA